jgi:hypothetical protein
MHRGIFAAFAAATVITVAFPQLVIDMAPARSASSNAYTVAVIGDTPYGPAQLEAFPQLVTRVNRDPKVDLVLHVGDIKNGSTRCDDGYFDRIAGYFDTFKDPLVYTPGDNEWTDCHRANNGGYLPTERLNAVRDTFFPAPGTTIGGGKLRVAAQDGFPENTLFSRSQVVFAALHVVGSDNGLAPWFGGKETAEQTEQRLAEVAAREAAALEWIDAAFDRAEAEEAEGVLLAMQADTEQGGGQSGFTAIRDRIAARAAEFGRPVLLLQGDSHDYLVDKPFAQAPLLTRVVVEGETIDEYLRLTVDPKTDAVFSWTRVRSGS